MKSQLPFAGEAAGLNSPAFRNARLKAEMSSMIAREITYPWALRTWVPRDPQKCPLSVFPDEEPARMQATEQAFSGASTMKRIASPISLLSVRGTCEKEIEPAACDHANH